jgi:hypothetical protein
LPIEFPGDPMMRVSHETIYQALFVQGRGELCRELAGRLTRPVRRQSPVSGPRTELGPVVRTPDVRWSRPSRRMSRCSTGYSPHRKGYRSGGGSVAGWRTRGAVWGHTGAVLPGGDSGCPALISGGTRSPSISGAFATSLEQGNTFRRRLDLREGSRDCSCTGTARCASCGSVAGHLAHEVPGAWPSEGRRSPLPYALSS